MLASKKAFSQYFPDCNKKAVKDGLKSLNGIRKLLAKPESWMQGNFQGFDENEVEQFCLIGASRRVDGPGEAIADRIMLAIIDAALVGDEFMDINSRDDVDENTEPIQEFNDDEDTTHRDILKLLDRSIKFGEKLLEYAPAKIKETEKKA